MALTRDHAGPTDPFTILDQANADRDYLRRLCAGVQAGAKVKQYTAKKAKRVVRQRRAEESRWQRFPERLREFAARVDEYISNPAFDPGRLLPKRQAKLTLGQRIELEKQQAGVRALVTRLTSLPIAMREFAAYVDLCLHHGTPKLSVGTKDGETLDRAKVLLCDYVRERTGRPRFQRAADLLNKLLEEFGARPITAEDLRKLCNRNPRLRKSPKLFQV